jgi:hypothetical protein
LEAEQKSGVYDASIEPQRPGGWGGACSMTASGTADLVRTAYAPGIKVIDDEETALRRLKFFEERHAKWSADFRDLVQSNGVDRHKLDDFIRNFAELWVDGKSRRQDSTEMMSVKASIRDHDRAYHAQHAGCFVLNHAEESVAPKFTPEEMGAIFEANANLLDALMPDYFHHVDGEGPTSINEIYVRRGVRMPTIPALRTELYYLSSYSFA